MQVAETDKDMDIGRDMVDTKGSVQNLLGVLLEVKVVLEIHQVVR